MVGEVQLAEQRQLLLKPGGGMNLPGVQGVALVESLLSRIHHPDLGE